MSPASTNAPGLVRVTVVSSTRRVDLALPGAIPVAELVPELARSVGLLDAGAVHGGYRIVTAEGRGLAGDAGLTQQGIEDGGLLTVTAGVDEEPPRRYDDVAEAMADVVERDLEPWGPVSGRRAALVAAGLLMALGAAALLALDSARAGVAAAVIALVLLTSAIVVSRVQHERGAAVLVAWMGAGYAADAGFILARDGGVLGPPTACAGAGALVAGLVVLVGLGEGRSLVIPPVILGATFLGTGLVMQAVAVDPAVVLTIALAFVVMLGLVFPHLALGVTGTAVDPLSDQDLTAVPDVDTAQLGADARVAHEILVALSATLGLLLVLIAPLAVSLGVAGALLALMCSLVVMLRTRQHRRRSEVLVGLASGVLGLVSIAVTMLWLQPSWRPAAAVVLAGSGTVVLAMTLVPTASSARRGRLGDVAETVSLLSLLPLLVLATGILPAVRG